MDLVTELFGRNLINGRLDILATFVAFWLSGAVIAGLIACRRLAGWQADLLP